MNKDNYKVNDDAFLVCKLDSSQKSRKIVSFAKRLKQVLVFSAMHDGAEI